MRISKSIAAVTLVVAVAACNKSGKMGGGAAGGKKSGEVVATVGEDTITVDEFKAKMDEQSPFVRARYTTLDRKKEFLDNLVRFDLLAQEAKRRGMDQDPEVLDTVRKVMVQQLIKKQFDDNDASKTLPDADMQAFYKEHLDDYVKPERVRVSHIFLAAPKAAANRAKVKAEAAKLLVEVKAKESGTDHTAFIETAKVRSDDAESKMAGGDLSFHTKEELSQKWGATLSDAAFGLQKIGDLGNLVETDQGFHVIKLTGRQNALDRPFETVKSQIQNRLAREKRTKDFDEFVKTLRDQAKVQVKDDVLTAVEVVPAGNVTGAAPSAEDSPGSVGRPAMPPGMPGAMQGALPVKVEVKPGPPPGAAPSTPGK